jgi:hypothetical protein
VLAVLFFLAAGVAAVFGVTTAAAAERPEVMALVIGLVAVFAAFGIGLASPWVGACQSARRGNADVESGTAPEEKSNL